MNKFRTVKNYRGCGTNVTKNDRLYCEDVLIRKRDLLSQTRLTRALLALDVLYWFSLQAYET